jgi:hypothetical protein
MDKVTIGWPSDIPSWDPEQRTVPDAQPIYKMDGSKNLVDRQHF